MIIVNFGLQKSPVLILIFILIPGLKMELDARIELVNSNHVCYFTFTVKTDL